MGFLGVRLVRPRNKVEQTEGMLEVRCAPCAPLKLSGIKRCCGMGFSGVRLVRLRNKVEQTEGMIGVR